MKNKNKILAFCLIFLAGIVFIQVPTIAGADSDSGEVSSDSGEADSGSSDPDFFIDDCNSPSPEREELCDQIYEVVDSSSYDDSSDFVSDASALSTFCSDWDFDSKGKVTICHKQKATVTAASRGACEGHLRNHPNDTVGPCTDEDGNVITNEEENAACIADSSSFYVTAEEYAADSGLAAAVDNCDDTIPVDPVSGDLASPSANPGRFNWREIFQ